VLLDTHLWLWWLTRAPQIRKLECEALDEAALRELPFISAISTWEAQMLVSRGRLIPTEPFEPWIRKMTAPDTIRILPIDTDVVVALHGLPKSFHGDPADRIIVATAIAHRLVLATHDSRIRKSRLVPIWRSRR
jgi:PIN domain nuclease of toxin-antitoxin system